MSLYNDLNSVLTPYANKIKQNEANVRLALSLEGGGAPTVVSSVSAMTNTSQIYVLSTDGNWYYYDGSAWVAGGEYGGVAAGSITTDKIADGAITAGKLASGAVSTDATLTQANVPADAKVVGDEIADLKSDLRETENEIIHTAGVVEELECGLTEEVKATLLACFAHVAWISDDGQTHYDALSNALNRSRVLSSIRAVFTQGSAVIYDTDELYSLKQYLTVTATYSDGTTKEVNNYTLSGKLIAGTNTITVAYNKKTTTFNVTVTHRAKTIESITATLSSSAAMTTDNVLDDLRPYLTVRATYSDGSTQTVSNYTLNGSLNVGVNTITVTYSGKTATFDVTVSERTATLQSITATFTQGSAVIYTDSSLDDLKPYLTITARYSNGTTQTVTNYTLSGTLTKGTSTITASYSGKTATFDVTVSETSADSIYALASATTFNGTSDYIDTGVKLHENDIDYTITIDFSTEDNATQGGTILHCMHEAPPYDGFVIDMYVGSSYAETSGGVRVVYSDKQNTAPKRQVPYSEKIVITHVAGSNAYKYYRYNSNELITTGIFDYQFKSISESIWLGTYRTTTGVKRRYFNGTISDFAVYNYAWTEEEANAYIQEDHS